MIKLKLHPGSLPEGMRPWHPIALIATWGGSGLMPFAPGTWGSLAALPFGVLIVDQAGVAGLLGATLAVTLAGAWAAGEIVTRGRRRDPGLVVIDEVAGMWLALAFVPLTWWGVWTAFLLFRIADILKPFPARWIDERVHGGLGVMLDDLVAGLYAGIASWAACRFVLAPVFA